jgi:hypothetical protein
MVRETFGEALDSVLTLLAYAGAHTATISEVRAVFRRNKRVGRAALASSRRGSARRGLLAGGDGRGDRAAARGGPRDGRAGDGSGRSEAVKVKTIAYGKTFNLGNYESQALGLGTGATEERMTP